MTLARQEEGREREHSMSSDDWGTIRDEIFDLADRRAGELRTNTKWRTADWSSLEYCTDSNVLAHLHRLATNWPTAAPDEEASSLDRAAEREIVGRIVPIAYLLGRMLMGTADYPLEWSESQLGALREEFEWVVSNTEYMLLVPNLGLHLIEDMATELGFSEHNGLLNVATMAYDDALLFAFLEHDRRGNPTLDDDESTVFDLNTQPSELSRLAGSTSYSVRIGVATNRHTPADTLLILARDSEVTIRRHVASNRSCDPATLALLARDPDFIVRRGVGSNPNTPIAVVKTLARDGSLDARIGAVGSRRLTRTTREQLVHDRSWRVRQAMAAYESDPELLEQLAADQNDRVQYHVALSRAALPPLLQRLGDNSSALVRSGVASNSAAPRALLERLALDELEEVRVGVARNRNIPLTLVTQLANDRSAGVRYSVAHNETAPTNVLRHLARDNSPLVRSGVAHNCATPKKILEDLSNDADTVVRMAVARCDSASEALLQRLSEDPDRDVRDKASEQFASRVRKK